MKTSFLCTLMFLSLIAVKAQDKKDDIEGLWLNHEKNTIIEIYGEDNTYYGRVHEVLQIPDDRSKNLSNEQLEMAKEQMKGKPVLADLTFKNDKWTNGRVINPKDNTTRANCLVYLENKNNDLKLKIKKGFLSTTKVWTRVENN